MDSFHSASDLIKISLATVIGTVEPSAYIAAVDLRSMRFIFKDCTSTCISSSVKDIKTVDYTRELNLIVLEMRSLIIKNKLTTKFVVVRIN